MDLSFSRFERDASATALPPDLAVLLVGVAARQACSPTALAYARLTSAPQLPDVFAPRHGAFNAVVARMLTHWQEE